MSKPEPIKDGEWAGAYERDAIKAALSNEEWADFCRFMHGQTMAWSADGRTIIYGCDFERWLRRLPPLD